MKKYNDWLEEEQVDGIILWQAGMGRSPVVDYLHEQGIPHVLVPESDLSCYAESDDGIHWTRPVLNKVEFEGSKGNNILDGSKTPNAITGNFTPFVDSNPNVAEDKRFKAIAGESKFASFFYSANGTDWQDYPYTAFDYPMDSQQTVFWHPIEQQYRVYLSV